MTDVKWDSNHGCYKLYFDFSEFEDINDKYFKRVYHSNRYTAQIDAYGTRLYTAKEAGHYQSKYSVFFSAVVDNKCLDVQDNFAFAKSIKQYLKEVE